MAQPTTAYGAQVGTPGQSAAVLRALASRAGLELRETSQVDLVAAVVAADAWSRVCGLSDLSRARRAGNGAMEAATAVLARAAGYGDGGTRRALTTGAGCDTVLTMLEEYRSWGSRVLDDGDLRVALWRAGSDLVCEDERLVGAALALQLAAEVEPPQLV